MANNATLEVPLSDKVDTGSVGHFNDGTMKLIEQLNDGSSVKALPLGIGGLVKDHSDSAHVIGGANSDGVDIDFIRRGVTGSEWLGSDSVHAADSADWDFGTGDFTVEGVINVAQKFCEPVLYDHPYFSKKFKKLGIPYLFIEMEYNRESYKQLSTRFEAFTEII